MTSEAIKVYVLVKIPSEDVYEEVVMGVYSTREKAYTVLKKDIETPMYANATDMDFSDWGVSINDAYIGCVWRIRECVIE